MIRQIVVLLVIFLRAVATTGVGILKGQFTTNECRYLPYAKGDIFMVASMMQCSQKCLASSIQCIGVNFNIIPINGRHQCEVVHTISETAGMQSRSRWMFMESILKMQPKQKQAEADSCKAIKKQNDTAVNGIYSLVSDGRQFSAYCDMVNDGFTLAARFSNSDQEHWMLKSGELWYTNDTYGQVASTDHNGDMINMAFSLVNGNDIKVSRTDDNTHSALLLSSGCLEEESLRQKITSFGDFRYGSQWQSNKCLGSCKATFSGIYATTAGFKYATSTCSTSSDILDGNNIGFWCHYRSGDGSVIMIGGGGSSCDRADHGIGVTESDTPTLDGNQAFYDFGDNAQEPQTTQYALNLWIR